MPIALITGISGQDGLLLSKLLRDRSYHVVGFGRRSTLLARGDLRQHLEGVELHFGDIAGDFDVAEAVQQHQPDEIYNLAAQSAPGLSWTQALETGQVTGMGAHRIFEAVRRFKPDCRIYQASSSEMFGTITQTPQDESTPFRPTNPYAAAKVYAHQTASIYRKSYGMFVACGILFNHESEFRAMRFLTQKIALGAACAKLGLRNSMDLNEEGEPVVFKGKLQLGNLDAARDWGAARDYVVAMWQMLQHPVPDDFVVGTGIIRRVRDLCALAYGHVGLDWQDHVISDPRFVRRIEAGATVANPAKARELLGWVAETTLESTIAAMVESQIDRLTA